eukprot:g19634.t1
MEGVINSAINQHLLQNNLLRNNLLSDVQFVFCQGHSAPDPITALVQIWTKELNSRGEVKVTVLDIKAAFDRVWHQGPLAKLESIGIRGQTVWWLESYLTHWKMVMVAGGQPSQLQNISAGVPQGIVLGPTFFSCFFNDLPFIIRSEIGMFADDCTIFSTIHDYSDTEAVYVQMQQNLDNIQAWADKWQATFTPHKCQAVTITIKRQSNHHPLTFNGVPITES